ncbi:MAG TPA: ArsI/CadI family heavy metal resistance metalloenzyme [Casimicrobiaceae bacterium]|nr:ArsI/CadI family heavy metal resistance metalloenzyme [Casimicrobiaceae bacterium]
MKRFHVHVAVANLDESVRFYSKVFGAEPSVRKSDYAKWMVEDPRLNFAISSRGAQPGVNHLGLQVDSAEELEGLRDQLAAADAGLVDEPGAQCCYAKSDKYWITDPQGIAWETYHSLGAIPMFGADAQTSDPQEAATACCAPAPAAASARIPVKARGGCCA